MESSFIIKGNIIFSTDTRTLLCYKNNYLVCENGVSKGVFDSIPAKYKKYKVIDYSDKLIVPGFIDLHTHASQYQYRGTSMDVELMEWLEKHAYLEEKKYEKTEYAQKSYSMFVDDLKKGFTTRACIFATMHKDSTLLLMDMLEKTNLITYVGLVEMDSNAPKYLTMTDAEGDTISYIEASKKYKNTFPIITPRFTPSCSPELMKKLGELRKTYNLNVQSHLDENPGEIELVKRLYPGCTYSETYSKNGLFGSTHNCVMAHCIYNTDEELALLKSNNVFVAHCPESNLNVSSGMAPIRKYLERQINVGLGSDVAGGSSLSLIRAARQAVQTSKMYSKYVNSYYKALSTKDAFYMLTRGGGKFFGKVGAFEANYEFDCLVIDDSKIASLADLSIEERLERFIYIGDESMLVDKYVKGVKIDIWR